MWLRRDVQLRWSLHGEKERPTLTVGQRLHFPQLEQFLKTTSLTANQQLGSYFPHSIGHESKHYNQNQNWNHKATNRPEILRSCYDMNQVVMTELCARFNSLGPEYLKLITISGSSYWCCGPNQSDTSWPQNSSWFLHLEPFSRVGCFLCFCVCPPPSCWLPLQFGTWTLVSGGLSCGCRAPGAGLVGPPEWLHRTVFDLEPLSRLWEQTLTEAFGMFISSPTPLPSPPPHSSTSRTSACIIGFSGSSRVTRECDPEPRPHRWTKPTKAFFRYHKENDGIFSTAPAPSDFP